jgi:GT2 family glycosyltransferase
MTLGVPERGAPELSVVMVSRGAWKLTEHAISDLVEHTDRPFELIVVDNASDAETRSRLSELHNVKVLLNDENRGFGPATNQGAAEARADNLLLLNTDVFVHPRWLDPLLEAVEDPTVGAVVPRYLNLDGSLQEAGALLARDGTVAPYGAGGDPELPCYRFPRRIDYGSAACMLVRREDFVGRGGFDDRYAPAYFEDVDFCLRLAQEGLSTVFEPRSSVTHVAHGSGEPSAAVELSERNHRQFVERWGSKLDGRPWTLVNGSEQAVVAARDAPTTPRVLILGDRRAETIVEALLDEWPRGRVTWATDGASDWLARGVEVLPRNDLGWLGDRLFHYDLVVCEPASDARGAAVLEDTQPQAPRVSLAELAGDFRSRLEEALTGAGVAPQHGSA